MVNVEHSANVLGRLAALGSAYHVDLTRVLDRSSVIAPELQQLAIVAVPHTFDRIAVMTQCKRDAIVRVLALCDVDQVVRLDTLAGGVDTTGAVVELETLPGAADRIVVSVQALGRRVLATDLERLHKFGAALDPTRELAITLGGAERLVGVTDRSDGSWTLQIEQSNGDPAQRAKTRDRFDRAAAIVGATRAQRNMIGGLHDSLVDTRESFVLVHVRPTGVELAVLWGLIPWEHVVRMMLEFYAGESPTKLGELAGAVGSDVAAMVEVVVGPTEPPRMRVSASIGKGWS